MPHSARLSLVPWALGLTALGFAVVVACGDGDAPAAADAPAPSSTSTSSTRPDAGGSPVVSQGDAATGRVARFKELKGVLHVHSAYSHDACDGEGIVDGGLNTACIDDLRAAPCNVGLDYVNLTDHPAHMNEYEPAKNLLYSAARGDELILGQDGVSPIGNLVSCPGGRKVLFTFGYEGNHTLPLMMDRHPTQYGAYATTRPLAEVKALVADLKSAGALVALAHSEQADLTADLIVEGGADLMEWYNPHGNFLKTLGVTDRVTGNPLALLSLFGKLDPFLAGSTSGAHADLLYLPLLTEWPVEGFTKWREVQKKRFVPGVFGSDVHQNVSIDPVCKGAAQQALCTAAAGGKNAALGLLLAGGQLVLSDGKRLDSYDRIMRWLRNVTLTNDLTPAGVKGALREGRSYGVFSVFGEPTGFYFEGNAGGTMLDMGGLAKGPIALTMKVPDAPTPTQTAVTFDANAAKSAAVRAVLFRTDGSGTVEVASATALGATLNKTVTEPGSYHVEIWLKPKHLTAALGPQTALADREFLWLISNPIRLEN